MPTTRTGIPFSIYYLLTCLEGAFAAVLPAIHSLWSLERWSVLRVQGCLQRMILRKLLKCVVLFWHSSEEGVQIPEKRDSGSGSGRECSYKYNKFGGQHKKLSVNSPGYDRAEQGEGLCKLFGGMKLEIITENNSNRYR